MAEHTNQTAEVMEEELDLGEVFAEETSPQETDQQEQPSENDAQEPQAEETAEQPEQPAEPSYQIKYNGQVMQLPVSQLTVLAQKGMNYDHVAGQLQELRRGELATLDELAMMAGMDRRQYIEALRKTAQDQRVHELVEDGATEEMARRMVEMQERDRRDRAQREAQERQQQVAARQRDGFLELIRAYPDVPDTLPETVVRAIQEGARPVEAYRQYLYERQQTELEGLRRQLQEKEQARKKAEENRMADIGSIRGDAAEDQDAFLAGFLP